MTTGIENDEDTPVRSNAFREQQERDYEVMFGKTMTTETSTSETKYFPCVEDPVTGRISIRATREPMTRAEASDFLRRHYRRKWLRCEAIPQPETHPYFTTGKAANGQRVKTR